MTATTTPPHGDPLRAIFTPARPRDVGGGRIAHIRRRGDRRALCGTLVAGLPAPDDAPTCVVCADLEQQRVGGGGARS